MSSWWNDLLRRLRLMAAEPADEPRVDTRILTEPGDTNAPRIEREKVDDFFAGRAAKISSLGPTTAVIYQDKNPDLASRRDVAERRILLPKIDLRSGVRVLDLGCGTGRWTADLVKDGAHYHGVDGCRGFIEKARELHAGRPRVQFTVCSVDKLDLDTIGEDVPFDRILSLGLLIYLNDDEVTATLRSIASVSNARARIIMREPMGLERRLTIRDHYSEDMDQIYHAVYRTQEELVSMIRSELEPAGFRLVESGDLFSDDSLNNRAETRQRWLLLER